MEVRAEEVDRRKKRSGVRTEPWGPQVLGEEGGRELEGARQCHRDGSRGQFSWV